MFWSLASTLCLFTVFPTTLSQLDNAVCSLGSFKWSFNSQDRSPCNVAASLLGVCHGGSYLLAPLPEDTHYLGPSIDLANPCQCSTVAYSLVSGCAACQNRSITAWSEWSSNCPTVSLRTFPEDIPSGVFVPGWAFLDVKPKGMFDVDLAEEHANATESTAVPRPTSTSTSLLPEPTVTTASGTAVDDNNKSEAEWKHTDKIGNAVVGSILGVGVLLFVFLAIRRWRSRKAAPSQTLSEADEEKGLPQVVVHAPNKH